MKQAAQISQWQEDLLVTHDRTRTRVRRILDWAQRTYTSLDTDKWLILPASIIAFLVLTLLVMLPVAVWYGVKGWTLVLSIRHPATSYRLYRMFTLIGRFVGCALMCVLVHALFIYMGWEAALQTLIGE